MDYSTLHLPLSALLCLKYKYVAKRMETEYSAALQC